MQEVNIGGVRQRLYTSPLGTSTGPTATSCEASCQILSIPDCKMQNKKIARDSPFVGISLGYGAWAGLITQTNASCHRNLLPIPTWKVQNKNLQGIPLQKRSHMGISLGVRASLQNINQTNPQPQDPISCCQNSLNSKLKNSK